MTGINIDTLIAKSAENKKAPEEITMEISDARTLLALAGKNLNGASQQSLESYNWLKEQVRNYDAYVMDQVTDDLRDLKNEMEDIFNGAMSDGSWVKLSMAMDAFAHHFNTVSDRVNAITRVATNSTPAPTT